MDVPAQTLSRGRVLTSISSLHTVNIPFSFHVCRMKSRAYLLLMRGSTQLAMQFAYIVVERLANDLAIMTNDHSDTTQGEGTARGRQAGEIAGMSASRYPFRRHL